MIQITKFFRDLLIAFFIITVVGAFNISISQCDIFQDFETSFLQDWSILNGTVSLSQNASVSGISSIKMSGVGYYSSIISNQDTFGYGSYSVWFMETGPFTDAYFRFHYQNSSNFYQLAMMPQNTDNPKLKLVKVVNGNTTTLAQIAPIFGTNQWFKMAVDRYDNGDINVFINDSLQISVNDTTLMTPSSIVFMAWDYTTYMDDFCYKIYPDTSSVNNAINLGNDIIACEGDSIQINAGNSLLNYVWNNGLAFGNILNVTTSGSYFVQAIDFGGTIYSDTIIVTFFPNPFIDLGNDTTICPNDTVIISSGSTGYNYIWSTTETTESITVMPSVSSNFILVAESNGCYSSDVIAVNVIDSISASLINDTLLCDGNYIVLYPSGSNNSYVWSTDQSSDSIIVNSTGMYSVTATNMCGLTASDSVFVLVLQVPSVNLGSNQDFCTGDSVSLSCNVPYSDYLWSTAETTQSIYVNSTGYYFVIVSNICGTASDVVFVNEINPPVLNLADTSICYGDTAYLNSFNSGCNFIWSTGDTSQVISVSPSSSQIYSVSVSNSGCSVVDSVMVNILPSPNVEIGADTIICIKDTVILDAGNTGASYSWSTGSTNQSIEIYPISPELIWVEVSMFGCETTDTVFIDIFPDSVVQLGSDTAFCFGGTLAINAGNPGSTYQWSNGETSQQIIINNAGFYSVWVSNQCGESDEDSIWVDESPLPLVELGQDTVLNFSQSLTLFAGYGYQNYLWGNGFSGESLLVDSSILVAGANEITVMVTDSNNCTAFDTLNVFYFDFQSINLVQGWSIISTYINPVDPNIASVMSVLDTNLIIVKNDSGYIYWPDYGINTIGELVIGEGYQLKVFSSQSLNVTGTILVPELTPININQGWNLIGYLRTTPALIDIMLLSIVNDIILVKDSDGFVYWPTYGINAIVNMNPGEGYQIKMSQLINFQYPQN